MNWKVANDGMQDSLESTLARRDSSTRLLMQLAQDAQQRNQQEARLALDTKRATADEDIRRTTQKDMAENRRLAAEDRDASRGIAEESRFQGRMKILPKGAILGKRDLADFDRFGATPLRKLHGPDEHDTEEHGEFLGTQDAATAAARLEETQRINDLRNEVAAGRLSVAQAQATLAADRLKFHQTQGFAPQVMPGANGQDVAVQFTRDGRAIDVPLPGGAHKTLTPEERFINNKADKAGTEAGTKPKSAGLLGKVFGAFSGNEPVAEPNFTGQTAPPASAPTAVVQMVDPRGRPLAVPASKVQEMEALGAKRVGG